jgi:hypothetical protein
VTRSSSHIQASAPSEDADETVPASGTTDPDPNSDPVPVSDPVPEPDKRSTKPEKNLAEEARLLREAETARRGGDIAAATARLDEHRRRFPRGELATERDAARVLVLCDAGRAADARRLAVRFLRRHPRSPLADRVRSACPPIP